MDEIQKKLIAEVADLHVMPEGAYNIRANSQLAARNTTANIDIVTKEDKPGIDIHIKPGTKNESVHIPVVLSDKGFHILSPKGIFRTFRAKAASRRLFTTTSTSGKMRMLSSWQAAVFPTAVPRIPSTTAYTGFLWARTPKSNMWKNTTVKATVRASVS